MANFTLKVLLEQSFRLFWAYIENKKGGASLTMENWYDFLNHLGITPKEQLDPQQLSLMTIKLNRYHGTPKDLANQKFLRISQQGNHAAYYFQEENPDLSTICVGVAKFIFDDIAKVWIFQNYIVECPLINFQKNIDSQIQEILKDPKFKVSA